MDVFLSLVAKDLIKRFGTNLTDVVVVFPSQRARLFFNTYLYKETDSPLWAPQYCSIEELFAQQSEWRKADSILLIAELYRCYTAVFNKYSDTPSTETPDEFFFFGEILLRDFEDIDKNRVDAKALFSNLKELDELKDNFSHLSEEQQEALRRFGMLFEQTSQLKESFLSIWNILGEVYDLFRKTLASKGIAYQGMQMREVAEREELEFPAKHYVFVGFNVLSRCEERLFKLLKPKSLFYWDYDNYYLSTEAGRFIKQNLLHFGNALTELNTDSFLVSPKEITFIAASSESGQSAVVSPWIQSLPDTTQFVEPDSAIVLCNETILPSVIHSVPSERVSNVNITMGFPIVQTPIANYIALLTDLQTKGIASQGKRFHYHYVLPVLRHAYTQLLFPEAKEIEQAIREKNIFFPDKSTLGGLPLFAFTHNASGLAKYLLDQIQAVGIAYGQNQTKDVYDGLYQESIFRAYQVVKRLYGLLEEEEWTLEKITFIRLLNKLLSTTQVPFHGEPVKGLQIMGVLETRTLDFKNLLLLSVNEGFMPGTASENTFVPQFLRKHFGMDTVEHQDSIYAYYFYRLIQRAERITLVYNTDKTGITKAEISRFLLQLLIDKRLTIRRFVLHSEIKPWREKPIVIEKTPEVMELLCSRLDYNSHPETAKPLTPSSLNLFIDCSLRFYYQRILGYRLEDDFSDEMDASVFGTIFHEAAESLYRKIGKVEGLKQFPAFTVHKEHLEFYLAEESDFLIRKFVSDAFNKYFFIGQTIDESEYNGEQLINFKVICEMLKRLIAFDAKRTPFIIKGLEWNDYAEWAVAGKKLRLGGIIDRLEETDGVTRVIDYKTGGKSKNYKELDDLFLQKDNRASYVFQLFVYSSVLLQLKQASGVVPELFYLQELGKENYNPAIPYHEEPLVDFATIKEDFDERLKQKIEELFDSSIPFVQTPVTATCKYCDFKEMCNR